METTFARYRSLEDKIVQYVLVKILNAAYETTYGFLAGSDPGEASTMHWTHWPQGWYAHNVNRAPDADTSRSSTG
ncbi:hypothetical protein JL973_09340 [Klebsiella pneumoniae]|nr:hypothetical protein [Klebsiella pneumoniae]